MSPYICLTVAPPLCVEEYAHAENGRHPRLTNGEKAMKHYGVAEWVDYSRGLVSGTDVQAMSGHREQMETSVAPEWLVRNAKAIFPVHAVVEPRHAARIAAKLMYDSFLAP